MRIATAALLALLAASPALAQETPVPAASGEELWDGVVAVVGDTVLLRSDVLLAIEQLRAAGQPVPTEPAAYERFVQGVMEERVDELLLVTAARRAGIFVDPAEVDETVSQQIQQVQRQFPSEAAFEQALAESGRTLQTYRAELARSVADQTLVQRYMRRQVDRLPRPPVTDAEVRAFFEAQRHLLEARPALVSFQQVIVKPQPAAEARQTALRTAEQVLRELREGADFEVLARRFSMDATRERGGDLGWFRQGQMVRPFEQAVWSLRPGQTTGIVQTDFGYHIIRLDRVRGPERQARHILIRPEITQFDVERARQRADSVARAIRDGASVTALATEYGTTPDERTVRNAPLDRLPPAYAGPLQTAQIGAVVGPIQVDAGPAGSAFAVARVTERAEAGEVTLAEVEEQIRERIQEQKLTEMILDDVRRTTYVSIRM